jgi:hypothetical protein
MAKSIVKGIKQNLEFGDYGNSGSMIRIEFDHVRTFPGNPVLSFCLVWSYNDNTGRTIELCHNNPEDIDFESFGTSYEQELKKVGLTPDEVQVIDRYPEPRAYNIKDADGVIRPFYDYEIYYNFVDNNFFDVPDDDPNKPKHRIGPFRSEEQAREYFNKYIKKRIWDDIENLTFTPVPPNRKLRKV